MIRHSYIAISLLIGVPLWAQETADQMFARGVSLQQSSKWTDAEKTYRAYLKRFGPKMEVLANLGAVLVREDRFTDAIEAYRQALKLAPDVLPLRLNLGLAYFKSGQLPPAVEQFNAVLDKQPGNRQVLQLRAMSMLELERTEEAVRDYSALMPSDDINVRLGLASAYMRLDRAAEAEGIMEPLFQTDTAEVKLLLGQVMIEGGRLDEAKKTLARAAELNPNLPTIHLNLGAVHWRQKDTDAAFVEWRKELKLHPESFQANYTLGAALATMSTPPEETTRLLRKAVAIQPGSAIALYQLAKLIWRQSQGQEAVSLLERSTRLDPKHRNAHYLLGTVYQSLGRKEEASKEFATVKRLSSEELNRTKDLFESAR